jgi:predicted alpha/beta superfamily hydrolase
MSINYQPKIEIIEADYEIPQLKKRRRIAALLPYNYAESEKQYPVLYLHDGQNLFDDNSPYGNWAVDKSLGNLAKQGYGDIIVISVDHGGEDRINEYMPFNTNYGEGQGKLYIQFLMQTLKPYVDRKYRVLPDGVHTGIGGSSMGGLISLYAGLTFPETFSRMMVFSPSLWLSRKIYKLARKFMLPVGQQGSVISHLYLYAGGKESQAHLPNVMRFGADLLANKGEGLRFKFSHNPDGVHHESNWREEFPVALKWLYFE